MRHLGIRVLWRNGHNLWILQCENVDSKTIGKVEQHQPIVFFVLWECQSFIVESSCNTARAGSYFNQQREKCHQLSISNSHVQFGVGMHFAQCQSWWVGNKRHWTVLLLHSGWALSQNWIPMYCQRTMSTICIVVHSWYEERTSKSPCRYAIAWSNDVGSVVEHDVQYQSLCRSVQNNKGYDGNRRCSHGSKIASHCLLNKGCSPIQCVNGRWSRCINGRKSFWGCRHAWHCCCSISWLISTHFQATCGIHGSTLFVAISLWWGWMASEYSAQWCCCVGC